MRRMAKFGLELSEEKSSIIKFGRFAGKEAGTFNFLGFTFVTTKSRNGKFMIVKLTSHKKLKVKKQKIKKWIKENMHNPVKELIKDLNMRLRGHYNYYGVSNNYERMHNFYIYVLLQLKFWLSRRSQKGRITWDKFNKILKYNPLLPPRITRPYGIKLLKIAVGSRMP